MYKRQEEGDDDKVNLLNEKKRADALINKAKIMMGEHRREIGRDTKKLIKQEIKAVSALNAKYTFGRNTEITDTVSYTHLYYVKCKVRLFYESGNSGQHGVHEREDYRG